VVIAAHRPWSPLYAVLAEAETAFLVADVATEQKKQSPEQWYGAESVTTETRPKGIDSTTWIIKT
jgi:hypothetical protein